MNLKSEMRNNKTQFDSCYGKHNNNKNEYSSSFTWIHHDNLMDGNESYFKEVKTKIILTGIYSPHKNINNFIDYLLKVVNRNTIFLIN